MLWVRDPFPAPFFSTALLCLPKTIEVLSSWSLDEAINLILKVWGSSDLIEFAVHSDIMSPRLQIGEELMNPLLNSFRMPRIPSFFSLRPVLGLGVSLFEQRTELNVAGFKLDEKSDDSLGVGLFLVTGMRWQINSFFSAEVQMTFPTETSNIVRVGGAYAF